MADKFDPYREALVMEVETEWPEDQDDLPADQRLRLEGLLHAAPEEAAQLQYVRTHTGFCRRIIVTPEDLERVMAAS
ncbi:MAG: hypothetical protein CMJ58_26210 [Planctomycetaceae bacterium]|nr:hypothetical protein [Planctomycetaceae bacterium]